MKLETKRLILRKPNKKDVNDLVEGLNNLKVSKNISTVPHPYRKKDATWWINHCNEKKKKKESYPFEIELKEEKKLVGACGLHAYDKFKESIEIGYWINENYWRKGIITEAAIAVINFAFEKLKINRIELDAYKENVASNAVAKKLGFTYEGTTRQSNKSKAEGKIHDTNIYSILKKEWPKNKRRLEKEIKKYE